MSPAGGSSFPRSAVPDGLARRVREERSRRRWSQERLASKVGVTRHTIMRVEAGRHVPTSHLVHALEEALDIGRLVQTWPEPVRPTAACFGPRIRQARRAAGITAARAAEAAGVSPATFSRFEAGATIAALVGGFESRDEGIRSDALALILGFDDARALSAFCAA